ncbi:hypothetical protein NHL50_02760 [Acidimicrobiia bacterium EGI L10123]|uniref:hypothetical protein n=1 Tax=Salinilacustrithrix flava TaxID=2957203 RepID=UPI003D7C2B3D|nr:hypothetical protein [Acidimicrobiia bacterium EGI L10123]
MIARLAAAVAAALLLVACGDDADGRYDARVDEVRGAIEAGDREGALAALEQLGTEGFYAHAEGEITDDEVAELAGLIEHARAQVDQELPPPTTTTEATTTTTTTTTAPPATPPAPVFEDDDDDDDRDDDDKKNKGRGNGRGEDGDDDDD